jgi:SAM-dependent methyltransferase
MMSNKNQTRLLKPEKVKLHGQERIFANVNRTLAPRDSMYRGNDAYYLQVGASALRLIYHALAAGRRNVGQVQRVLDYACGFGRVLRWLQAGFPLARIVAVDADPKAVNAVKEIFDVDAFVLDLSLREEIGSEFDLIWVGSLATHLPEDQFRAVIVRLGSLLSPRGLVVATTHGPHVANRIANGEKAYGLDPKGIASLLSAYERSGYGFSAYPKQQSYGIAVCTASKLMSLIETANLYAVLYQERGWVSHQDCVAIAKTA